MLTVNVDIIAVVVFDEIILEFVPYRFVVLTVYEDIVAVKYIVVDGPKLIDPLPTNTFSKK